MFSNQARWEAPDRDFVGHRDILTRSRARYDFIASQLHGVTLDVGCGRGYGFELINQRTSAQIGVDISLDFLRDAREAYPSSPFVQATGSKLPFRSGVFDSVIAFEVIEHIEDDLAFLKEMKRVAQSDAFFAISTPNQLFTSGGTDKPLNPFHVREYSARQLVDLLSQVFGSVSLFGQHDSQDDNRTTRSLVGRWIDRIPARWKWLMPAYVQDILSVGLRPALRPGDCRFEAGEFHDAHTFVCTCST